jgi:hypothetical protein
MVEPSGQGRRRCRMRRELLGHGPARLGDTRAVSALRSRDRRACVSPCRGLVVDLLRSSCTFVGGCSQPVVPLRVSVTRTETTVERWEGATSCTTANPRRSVRDR